MTKFVLFLQGRSTPMKGKSRILSTFAEWDWLPNAAKQIENLLNSFLNKGWWKRRRLGWPLKCSLICTPLIREVLWLRQFQACPSTRADLLGDTNVQGRWAGLKLTECLTLLTSFICMSRTEKIIFVSWLRTWPRFEKEAWSHSEKGSTSSRCVGEWAGVPLSRHTTLGGT